jgi:sugar-specific transcriptional regulator TrmB
MIVMDKIKKGLALIGLTNLEAEVCLKLLNKKQAKVSELAKATKITRTQLYPLLEKLLEKGIIEKTDKKVIIYKVIEPIKLLKLIENWESEQTKIVKEFKNYIKNR